MQLFKTITFWLNVKNVTYLKSCFIRNVEACFKNSTFFTIWSIDICPHTLGGTSSIRHKRTEASYWKANLSLAQVDEVMLLSLILILSDMSFLKQHHIKRTRAYPLIRWWHYIELSVVNFCGVSYQITSYRLWCVGLEKCRPQSHL